MSEQTYYGREDEVETPEVQLDNLRAQEGAAKAVDIWAHETLVNLYDRAMGMWAAADVSRQEAEQRGDEAAAARLLDTQNGLTELYKGAEHMQQNLIHTNAAMKNVLEAAQALAKQKATIEEELNSLVEAVENADFNDPRIADMAEMIETDVYEMISQSEDFYDASEDIYDSAISDMLMVIRQSAPHTTYMIGERFFRTLLGDYEMNDVQRGLLLSLVNTITLDDES